MNLGARLCVALCLASVIVVADARSQDGAAKAKADTPKAALDQAFKKQDWDKVIEVAPTILEMTPNDGLTLHHYGYALHAQGRLDEALKMHLKLAEVGKGQMKATGLYNAACAYALKKDKEKAFEALAASLEVGPVQAGLLESDPDLSGLHDDARWPDLVKKAEARAGELQLFAYSTQRMASRILGFGPRSIEVNLEWGPIDWKAEYETMIESGKLDGQSWRLGADFWTTFDTNVPVTFGGQSLAPGMYYVTMARREGKYLLQFHDPNKAREQKIDPFPSVLKNLLSRPVEVETECSKGTQVTKQLTMALAMTAAADAKDNATMSVDFGPYHAVTPMSVPTKLVGAP